MAAPGSYFNTFERSILSVHHCICNVVPGVRLLGEMHDIAGLIAPRPVLMINGREDNIFPIESAQSAFGHLKLIYEAFGAAGHCELHIGEGGHRYCKSRVWEFVRERWAAGRFC